MSKKRHTPEQIINKPRQAEVELAKGATVAHVREQIGVLASSGAPDNANSLSCRGLGARSAKPHPRN